MSKVARSTDPYKMKDRMTAGRLANEDKKVRSDTERKIQEEFRNHMGKNNNCTGKLLTILEKMSHKIT